MFSEAEVKAIASELVSVYSGELVEHEKMIVIKQNKGDGFILALVYMNENKSVPFVLSLKVGFNSDDYCMSYNKSEDVLEISLTGLFESQKEDEIISNLNNDEKLKRHIKNVLNEVYRFDGNFKFVEDAIPF